jgi:hypothetical protein
MEDGFDVFGGVSVVLIFRTKMEHGPRSEVSAEQKKKGFWFFEFVGKIIGDSRLCQRIKV